MVELEKIITPEQMKAVIATFPPGFDEEMFLCLDIMDRLKLVKEICGEAAIPPILIPETGKVPDPPDQITMPLMPPHWIRDLALRGVANLTPEERYPPSKYLEFAPKKTCWNNPYRVVQRHKQRRQEARTIACSCHGLNCGTCGPQRKDDWEDTLLPQIRAAEHVETLEVPAPEWRTLQMKIWRQKGEYVRTIKARPDDDGELVDVDIEYREEHTHVYKIVTTAKVGGAEVEDDVVARKKIIRNLLLFAPFHRGAVTVSKGWRPSKGVGQAAPEGNSDWETVPRRNGKPGVGRMGDDKRIREVLERDGVTQIDARDDGNRSEIRFRVPEAMDDFHLSLLVDRLLNCPQGRKKKSPGK